MNQVLQKCDKCKTESNKLTSFIETDDYSQDIYNLCPKCLEKAKYEKWERECCIKR